jgi:hypothetical protein
MQPPTIFNPRPRIDRVALDNGGHCFVIDGALLHTGDILAPERLSNDPATGRLTFNGFFTCRRNAA